MQQYHLNLSSLIEKEFVENFIKKKFSKWDELILMKNEFSNCQTVWKLSVKISIILLVMHLSNATVSFEFE